MAEEKAAPAAGDDIISMALEELTGQPAQPEDVEQPEAAEDLSQTETEEESEEKSEDASEDVKDEESEDEESEEDDEEGEKDDEAPQEKIQKRINKLTAQKKEALEKAQTLESEYAQAKTRLAELEAQVNEAARPMLQPTAENPLADVDTPEALEAKVKSAQEVRRWALRNTDGATVKRPDGTEVYLDSDQVKDYLIKADDVLTVHAPARQQWLAQRQPAVEAAKNLFPDIFKKGSPMHQAYQATIKQAPELLKLPQNEYWVGLALYGEQQLMQKQAADQAKAKAAKKVSASGTSKTPTPVKPVSTPKSATKGAVNTATRNRVLSGAGGISDLEAYMSEALFS
jgi:predicted RNase H-like nuclease (RuvC/YqgF family)